MQRLPQPGLYDSTERCLAFARTLPPPRPPAPSQPPVPVHFYWQGRAFGPKPALCLKSFLATQDPRRFRAWLWLEDEATYEAAQRLPDLAPLLPAITLRRYDWSELARGTPLADQPWTQNLAAVARSDLARLVCLYHHGGCYSDLDALFLRDLGSLLDHVGDAEFCFQWSADPSGTNAFCRHHAGSALLQKLLLRAVAAQSVHPFALLHFNLATPEILMLPVALFSPLWLQDDKHERYPAAPYRRFAGFFRKFGWFHRRPDHPITLETFFPGAFTYHWHNQWATREHRDSYAGHLDADCRSRLGTLGPLPIFGDPGCCA